MSAQSKADITTDLCISCQLCCNGTFFEHVSISAAESRRLEQFLPGICNSSTSELPQPCLALSRTQGCTAYHLRPNACAKFTCSVLHRTKTGQLPQEDAEALIDKAKELKQEADHAGGNEGKLARYALKRLVEREFLRD